MNSQLQLILGGARSGKSRFALDTGGKKFGRQVFLATATAGDEEMEIRVKKHQLDRGPQWETIEEPYHLAEAIERLDLSEKDLLVVDCATLWISNLLCGMGGALLSEGEIVQKLDDLVKTLSRTKAFTRVVSNEVGLSIVPDNVLSRQFRDLQGLLNQKLASEAGEVLFFIAGLSQKLK